MMLATLLTAAAAYGTPRGNGDLSTLEDEIREYIGQIDARIGVAAIINGADTIEVNGRKEFPMMSVFKFPLALTVANIVETKNQTLNSMITVSPDDLKTNTYSPMLKKYGRQPLELSLRELLEWSLKESDNNAADILLKVVGGVDGMNEAMKVLKMPADISVGASEDDMHRDPFLIYLNRSTPLAMAQLFYRFLKEMKPAGGSCAEIAEMLETCRTGVDRIPAGIADSSALVGHKTGTGDELTPGRISAVNDAGYVVLSDGTAYSVAIFVADSSCEFVETERIISCLSEIVYNRVKNFAK